MKKSIYIYLLLITSILPLSCGPEDSYTIKVSHAGALRNIMHKGDLSAKAALDTTAAKGVYAVGALDSLRGEILIEDGITYISRVRDGSIVVNRSNSEQAGLLVYASVSSWAASELTGPSLEKILLEKAQELGLEAPFPFQLKGSFPTLDYHVINFDPETGDLSNHKEGAYRTSLANQPAVVIGFYSDKHQGVFTHHDSHLHMHVRNLSGSEMGHIDAIDTKGISFTLLLPKS